MREKERSAETVTTLRRSCRDGDGYVAAAKRAKILYVFRCERRFQRENDFRNEHLNSAEVGNVDEV